MKHYHNSVVSMYLSRCACDGGVFLNYEFSCCLCVGRHFVQWLYEKVAGFSSRNDARTLAKRLLKDGYLKHTTGKSTFSEQCYYVFNLERVNSGAASTASELKNDSELKKE